MCPPAIFHSLTVRRWWSLGSVVEAGAQALICDEVEALLGAYEEANSFIENSAFEIEAQAVAEDQNQLSVDQTIGHYRIVSLLGAGGMGEVFLAQDTQLDRPVALKVMSAELARDPNQRKRFRTEARAASGLNHPHVCVIYDVGETKDGRPFLAMEYVEGQTLDVILHERQLEEYYCTLCYAVYDLKHRTVVIANSGLPYPIRCSGEECGPVEIAGVPLGAFAGSHYDEVTFDLRIGDLFVFCTDGVYEAMNADNAEFGTARVIEIVREARGLSSREIVDRIFAAVEVFRGDHPPNDDMTAVAVRITS